ncbi:MAG: hypothetical protein VB099_04480 [Candidatus Limiplasma sp.]|nr:hypothetical protein [Candidatus Limiplasma sp.]
MTARKLAAGLLCLGLLLLGHAPLQARADDTGVLSENELNAWLRQLLLATVSQEPQNAPVGEEALTQDGYAFLYEQATLFYDKPVLDQASKLQAVSVTDEGLETPRGLRIGSPEEALVQTYGWQNSGLMTDGLMAPFYLLDQLPQAAYWAWGQMGEEGLEMVNCFIHVQVGEDSYTDAGIQYTLEDDAVSGIRIYGLGSVMSLAEVLGNLETFVQTQAAVSGDELQREEPILDSDSVKAGASSKAGAPAAGVWPVSTQEAFGTADLQFSRMDLLTLTPKGALTAFGSDHLAEDWRQDPDSGSWRLSRQWPGGVSLSFALDSNKENPRLAELVLADGCPLEGPRGIRLGDSPQSVVEKFRCDGPAWAEGQEFFLYGSSQALPCAYGTWSPGELVLHYEAQVTGGDGASRKAALRLRFQEDRLVSLVMNTDSFS